MRIIKNSTKSVRIVALAAALVLFVCSACTAQEGDAAQTASPKPTVVKEQLEEEYNAKPGGDMAISIPASVASWDPVLAEDEEVINMLSLIYETPLELSNNGIFSPGLIESWTVDDSKTVFTFKVRQGVTFHSGKTMTADDVLYTINKILALDAAQPVQEESTAEEQTQTQAADTQANRYAQYNDEIVSVDKTDDYTIVLTMNTPGRDALYFMTFPVLCSETDAATSLNGTGVYCVQERREDGSILLAANTNWWKVAPYIQTITAVPNASAAQKASNYDAGVLSLYTTKSIAASKLKTAGVTQVVDYMTNYYDCIIPNLFKESLKEAAVRKALSYAIDRREIVSSVLLNHAVAAEIPISPDFFAYDVKYKLYEHDVMAAKELLQSVGYTTEEEGGNPLTLTMIVPSEIGYEYRLEVARLIANQLSEIGVVCNVQELSVTDYTTALNNGSFDLAYCSYYMDQNPDVSFMLRTGESLNYGMVASSDLDAILDRCNAALSESEVKEAYGELQQYFIDKVPQIGLFYRMHSVIVSEEIKGIENLKENNIFKDVESWSIAQ